MHGIADADVRLVGSPLPNEGRLEVKVAGVWGTVCDDDFDDADASVACSMFGHFEYVSKFSPCNWILFATQTFQGTI